MVDSPDRSLKSLPTPQQILAFYLESGVDCAIEESAIDRLATGAEGEPALSATPRPREIPEAPETRASLPAGEAHRKPRESAAMVAPEVAAAAARDAAKTAPTLDALRGLVESFDGCALRNTATQLVFGDGNPQARVMFVGEAPGRDEDIEGRPFVGRSGKLLDLMLAAIGLDRESAYIANVIPWRPPGNRDPSPQETQICLPFIRRQIELVNPDILVCLGKPSSQAVLSLTDGIMKTRGRWRDYDTGTRSIRAMATLHPAYLLRQPSYKRLAYLDLRAVQKALKAAGSIA